jgi:hypothetical protein
MFRQRTSVNLCVYLVSSVENILNHGGTEDTKEHGESELFQHFREFLIEFAAAKTLPNYFS